MKTNYLSSIVFGAVLIMLLPGCQKSQIDEQGPTYSDSSLYRMTVTGNSVQVEAINIQDINGHAQEAKGEKSNGHKAIGHATLGTDAANFNAIQNNGGMHGNTHYSGVDVIDLKFDSECLLVLDNKAYWGGTVTVWEVSDELAALGLPFAPGWQFFWSARDNGQGSNADPDEMGDTFIIIPPGLVASDNGFETWCDYADYDYNLYIEDEHEPHGYAAGDDPTNIKIN